MKRTLAAILLCGWGLGAQASEAAKTESPVRTEEATKVPAPEESPASTASERRANAKKMRCVTEQLTGSRFAKRVCHTGEEWARLKEAGVEAVKNIQARPIPVQGN